MKGILLFFKELLGFGTQIAANQGAKIPMKQSEIEARAEKKAGEIQEAAKIDDWVPKVKFFNKCMGFGVERHAINQVKRLLDGGHVITSVNIERDTDGLLYLFIRYNQGFCKTYYRIEVNQKKAGRYL